MRHCQIFDLDARRSEPPLWGLWLFAHHVKRLFARSILVVSPMQCAVPDELSPHSDGWTVFRANELITHLPHAPDKVLKVFIIDREAREIIRLVASVRPSVRLFVCLTYEIQSKTSVCLSVIKESSRSKSCAQRSGAFNQNAFLKMIKKKQY